MSQERWDIVLHFLTGPLALREDVVAQGPVVRIGADPGPPQNIRARTGLPSTTIRGAPPAGSTRTVSAAASGARPRT